MDRKVRELLERKIWNVATHGIRLCVVPIGLKTVLSDGRMVIADVFMELTRENIRTNGEVAVSVYDAKTLEAYQIWGHAAYETEGDAFDEMVRISDGREPVKGVITIMPERIIDSSPGNDNGKDI